MSALGTNGSGLHERLLEVAGDRTYRALADLTGQNAETVRRYMQGQSPSVEFLAAVCGTLGVSADWLLTGQGPMRLAEARRQALAHVNPGELLSAVAASLEALTDRVDRVEVFVQTLESRIRASAPPPPPDPPAADSTLPTGSGGPNERRSAPGIIASEPARTNGVGERIASALPQRSPPPAR